jgi:transcriptional regulator of acetoin/glycerol metabolism
MGEYEKRLLARLLRKHPAASGDNPARQPGVGRATLYRKLAAHKLL